MSLSLQQTIRALDDPTRRTILERLRGGVMTAGELGDGMGLTAATVSHHLSCLKEAGLVSDRREGRYIYYELNTSVFEDLLGWILSLTGGMSDEGE